MKEDFFVLANSDLREAYVYLSGLDQGERIEIIEDERFHEIIINDLQNDILLYSVISVSSEYISVKDFLFNNPVIIRTATRILPELYKPLLECGTEGIRIDEEALMNYILKFGYIWFDSGDQNITSQLHTIFHRKEFWYNMLNRSEVNDEMAEINKIKAFNAYMPPGLKEDQPFMDQLYQLNPALRKHQKK